MTLQELRYLVALAEAGHFGRAARACGVSQPTLSQQLRRLEDGLGVRLFERTNRRLRATAAGERIVAQARRVLEESARLVELAAHHRDPLSGPLGLGVIPTLGPYLPPWLLPPLKERWPDLAPLLREDLTAGLLEQLRDHRLDAALVSLPVDAPDLVALPLFDEPFHALLPKGHPLAARAALEGADLAGETVLPLAEGHCLRDQALAFCRAHGARAEAANGFRAASLETVRRLVAAGLGVSLVPALAAGEAPDGEVAVRPFAEPAPARRIGLVWRRHFPRAEGLKALGEVVREHLPEGLRPVYRGPAGRR